MFDATAWLERNAPGYGQLPDEARNAITEFSLLWSLFESQILNESASASAIIKKCEFLDASGLLHERDFVDCLSYFQTRYSEYGTLGPRFEGLYLRKNDKRDLVAKVILGGEASVAEKLAACLIVVYRYRNNYFHGIKWAYRFHDQLENFQHSNRLLAYVMDSAWVYRDT